MFMVKDSGNIAQSQIFVAESWLKSSSGPLFTTGTGGSRSYNYNGFIEGAHWTFDGSFQKRTSIVPIEKLPSPDAPFKTNELAVYPISHVEEKVRNNIRARGEMFWKCRRQHYVCYSDRSGDGIQSAVRFIDYALEIANHAVKLTYRLV
jgi:hypothetical protein